MRQGAARRTFKDCRFVLALSYALLMIPTAGFGASALGHALRQNAGQGSSGGGQQQSRRQTHPAQRPPGGKPGDRPTIQPVPQPGKPSPGKPGGPGKPGRPIIKPTPPRPQPGKPGYRPPRPPNGRPPYVQPRPPYQWRPNDRDRMRRHYRRNFGYINRSRRPVFVIGGSIPFGDRGYFTPVPTHLAWLFATAAGIRDRLLRWLLRGVRPGDVHNPELGGSAGLIRGLGRCVHALLRELCAALDSAMRMTSQWAAKS